MFHCKYQENSKRKTLFSTSPKSLALMEIPLENKALKTMKTKSISLHLKRQTVAKTTLTANKNDMFTYIAYIRFLGYYLLALLGFPLKLCLYLKYQVWFIWFVSRLRIFQSHYLRRSPEIRWTLYLVKLCMSFFHMFFGICFSSYRMRVCSEVKESVVQIFEIFQFQTKIYFFLLSFLQDKGHYVSFLIHLLLLISKTNESNFCVVNCVSLF